MKPLVRVLSAEDGPRAHIFLRADLCDLQQRMLQVDAGAGGRSGRYPCATSARSAAGHHSMAGYPSQLSTPFVTDHRIHNYGQL